MSDPNTSTVLPRLEAASPFELRVGRSAPESAVRRALDTGDLGFLHSFTTGSAVDGPGVRVVAWTAGCQFRCLYCHNPDTWSLTNGLPVTLDRAVEQLRKYRIGLQRMNGGLTISGGEPLMQDRFVVRLFAAARAMGVHTALDTNGFLGDRLADAELGQVDLVMLDIKSFDPDRHRHVTGKDVAPVLAFARRLADLRRPVWLRYVLVPGLTDDADDIARVAQFAGALGNVGRVDVLPFHQMGRFKWSTLGLDYKLADTQPPSNELVQRTIATFKAEGLSAC
ncbi:MAG: pyruvate formate-lyase-activating protein [Phycisphaerae bacterium]